jgi:hypothetical protein
VVKGGCGAEHRFLFGGEEQMMSNRLPQRRNAPAMQEEPKVARQKAVAIGIGEHLNNLVSARFLLP